MVARLYETKPLLEFVMINVVEVKEGEVIADISIKD